LIVRGINIDCKEEEVLLIQIDDLQELKDSNPTAVVMVPQDIQGTRLYFLAPKLQIISLLLILTGKLP
jgi:hypothetical protein